MDKYEIKQNIVYILENCGSDIEEKQNPGSKVKFQAKMIIQLFYEIDKAQKFMDSHQFEFITFKSSV